MDCVEIHITERRYRIFEVRDSWVGKEDKWKKLEPFANVNKLDNGLLMGTLMNSDLIGVNPNSMATNSNPTDYRIMSLSDIDNHIYESIENGFLFSLLSYKHCNKTLTGETVLSVRDLYNDATSDRYMKTRRSRVYFTYQEYKRRVEYLIGEGSVHKQTKVDGGKVRAMCFHDKTLEDTKKRILSNWFKHTKIYISFSDVNDAEHTDNILPFGGLS